jgi:hypothetical protein
MTSLASQQKLDRGGGGFLQPGGLFGGPRMSARVGYAASKGKYYSSADKKHMQMKMMLKQQDNLE